MSELSETLPRALAGDQHACRELFLAHAGRVRAYLRRCGFEESDADDLTQETFLRVFKSLWRYDESRAKFSTWVGAIARNVARKHFARRSQPEAFDPQLAEAMFAGSNPGPGPAESEEFAELEKCIDLLDDPMKQIVSLRYVEAMSTRGIAERLGMPEATIRLRLGEAHGLLSRCMRQKGFLK